jgi:hypothetical protein
MLGTFLHISGTATQFGHTHNLRSLCRDFAWLYLGDEAESGSEPGHSQCCLVRILRDGLSQRHQCHN